MKYIIANWKMNLGVRESVALARGVLRHIRGKDIVPQIVLCPAMTALGEVQKSLAKSKVLLGGQNAGVDYRSGAYTGEVSPSMLEDVKCKYVLIGHSERRHFFAEDLALIRQRLQAVVKSNLTPILCVGELRVEHENGEAFSVIEEQLESAIKHVDFNGKNFPMIAYEPVWSIGTGDVPDIGYVVEMHAYIRDIVSGLVGVNIDEVKVLYGGSINENNAHSFLRESEVDGVLVGGASLKINSFTEIIDVTLDIMEAQK